MRGMTRPSAGTYAKIFSVFFYPFRRLPQGFRAPRNRCATNADCRLALGLAKLELLLAKLALRSAKLALLSAKIALRLDCLG